MRPGPPLVLRIHPRDGATGVFRDATVVACLSHAADAATVGPDTFRVQERGGALVPGRVSLSADRALVIWTAGRLLRPGVEHVVTADGLRDVRGLALSACTSRFVPCDLVYDDVSD
jgi:hypothetical protein